MQYQSDAKLAMAEARVPMKYRVPDAQRLEWAQRIVAAMGDQSPKTTTEVYAREQIICTNDNRRKLFCKRSESATSQSPPRPAKPMR